MALPRRGPEYYQYRKEQARIRGLSVAQARGHARQGELSIRELKQAGVKLEPITLVGPIPPPTPTPRQNRYTPPPIQSDFPYLDNVNYQRWRTMTERADKSVAELQTTISRLVDNADLDERTLQVLNSDPRGPVHAMLVWLGVRDRDASYRVGKSPRIARSAA